MKRSVTIRAALAAIVLFLAMAPASPKSRPANHLLRPDMARLRAGTIPTSLGLEDDPDAQAEMEFMMQRDPRSNAIPRGIHRREILLARGLPGRAARVFRIGPDRVASTQALVWTERGPNNVGGRTRAFAIDVTSATTLIAGSVAGGIWRSTDDG